MRERRESQLPNVEELFDEHAQGLFGFIVYRTGNRALAEDVVADTFERAFKARHRFDRRRGGEKSWLYAIALNRLRDLKRRAAVESAALEGLAKQAEPSIPMESRVASDHELHRALRDLPPAERDALALRFGGDLTVPEVAKVLGEPLSRIEGRVYRGLQRLREQIEQEPAN